MDLAGLVSGRPAVSVAHGVEQISGPREPGSVVRERRCQRQTDLVGGAAGGVIEHPAITHLLGYGAESVQNGVVVASVSQGLGSQVTVMAWRDRDVFQR